MKININMRKIKKDLKKWLVFPLVILFSACTKEVELPLGPERPAEQTPGGLEIILQTPQPDKVVMSGALKNTETEPGLTVYHEEQEWTVKQLGVYIFKKNPDGGNTDADYTLVKKTEKITFLPESEAGTGENLAENQGIDKGNGIYSYTEPVEDYMMNSTLKILLVANEGEITSATTDAEGATGTKLSDFRKIIAKAELTDQTSADVISGGKYDFSEGAENSAYKGIVMSAVATKGDNAVGSPSNEEIKLSNVPQVHKLKATLVRNVARIDIRMNKKAMVLKKAVLKNAASKAYLFAQASTTAAPDDAEYYTMLPTDQFELLGTGYGDGADEGISYKVPETDDETEEVTKDRNTLKHVFYLYEQVNSEAKSATVEITYTLPDKDGKLHKGVLEIPLKKTGDTQEYIPTTRNHLYTIVLGDGSMDGKVNVDLIVEDWIPNDLHEFVPLD